jgi:transposase-like protein
VKREFSEAWCYEVLRRIRWPNGLICPFCAESRVTIHSKSATTPRRRYLCLGCRQTFSDLTGTPFARTNLPLSTWFLCLRLMGQGRRTSELARELGVKGETMTRIQRRLTMAMGCSGLVRQLRDAVREARSG